MAANDELLIVRQKIYQERETLVRELNSIFNERTIREADRLRSIHDSMPIEDLLRPFNF